MTDLKTLILMGLLAVALVGCNESWEIPVCIDGYRGTAWSESYKTNSFTVRRLYDGSGKSIPCEAK